MCHPIVRRLTAAVALTLVLASAAPALAAPGNGPHASQVAAVTGLPLLDRLLDWLGLPGAAGLSQVHGTLEKSTTSVPITPAPTPPTRTLISADHGGLIDPNG